MVRPRKTDEDFLVVKAQDAVQLTKELVRMNTINPPGREEPGARYLGPLLETAGFQAEYHSFGEARVKPDRYPWKRWLDRRVLQSWTMWRSR